MKDTAKKPKKKTVRDSIVDAIAKLMTSSGKVGEAKDALKNRKSQLDKQIEESGG